MRLAWAGSIVGLMALSFSASSAFAQPGTLIKNITLPVSGFGVSVASNCTGTIYFTNDSDSNLYSIDQNGNLTGTTPITNASGGGVLFIDEFAWDEGRKVLWAQEHNTNPIKIYQLNPTTGIATFQFAAGTSIGTFRDGIAYDGSDDSLWISGDVSTVIDHVKATDGSFINQITPKNAAGGNLGFISGVVAGSGDLLYLGQNGLVKIVQVTKSTGGFLADFTSPGGSRDEGLECDPINFAPKLALLSREANGFISAIEVEPGTCGCGGGPAISTRATPALSTWALACTALLLTLIGAAAVRRQGGTRSL